MRRREKKVLVRLIVTFFKSFLLWVLCGVSQYCIADSAKELFSDVPQELTSSDVSKVLNQMTGSSSARTTIIPALQTGLEKFLVDHGNPVAAVVIVDVRTGRILAIAQGKNPKEWSSSVHTALYSGFPAASLFKMVSTISLLETNRVGGFDEIPMPGGCQHVESRGGWLLGQSARTRSSKLTLARAFALSCNRFYARVVVKHLGLGTLAHYAQRLGWGKSPRIDFAFPKSPISLPSVKTSGVQAIGKFAAGFGKVGISPLHAAWLNTIVARDGRAVEMRLFESSLQQEFKGERLFSVQTASELKRMMHETVLYGTATTAFRKRRYRRIRQYAFGKTGTLSGIEPKGSTTWFAGFMSYQRPEIAVSSVVVNEKRWSIKGMHLAAEAFRLWHYYRLSSQRALSKRDEKRSRPQL